MNQKRNEEQLLRRLEVATRRNGDGGPEMLDTESCMLHDGWQRLSQLLDRATAEHDSVVVEERLLAGVQRLVVLRRMRRRVVSLAVAASLLGMLAIGAWIGAGRSHPEIAESKRSLIPESSLPSTRTSNAGRPDTASGRYPPGGWLEPDFAAEDDVWSDELDWQVAETRDFITLLEEELANDFL